MSAAGELPVAILRPLRLTPVSSRSKRAADALTHAAGLKKAEIKLGERNSHVRQPAYQGAINLILPLSLAPPARPSRAISSMVGQFCRKNMVASWIFGACTLTLQACLPPRFEIWK
jgi:hypothetical protein